MKIKVLLMEGNKTSLEYFSKCLRAEEMEVIVCGTLKEVKATAGGGNVFSAAVIDMELPGDELVELIRTIKASFVNPESPIIMTSAFPDIRRARLAQALGAADFIQKPVQGEELAIRTRRLVDRRTAPMYDFRRETEAVARVSLIGDSEAIQDVWKKIRKVARTKEPVLLTGENGTGKGVAAKLIHAARFGSPDGFTHLLCNEKSMTLVESELFGYEKGAFSGATSPKPGILEQAGDRTFFLDEIGELHPEVQTKFLKVLQEKEFQRLGGVSAIQFRAVPIFATNKILEDEVRQGRFREDLYYRINRIEICLPPLRERKEDIPLLIDHFMNLESEKYGKKHLSPTARDLLMRFNYPGNVRSLNNIITSAFTMAEDDTITPMHLPLKMMETDEPATSEDEDIYSLDYPSAKGKVTGDFEKMYLSRKFDECGKNILKTAEKINIDRKKLSEKLKKYGISRD